MSRAAAHHFSNNLRYRDPDDPGQTQLTPAYILGPVRADLRGMIGLDPCTTADNPVGALCCYTQDDDGLACRWGGWDGAGRWAPTVFCNPPYGKAREPWVDRCIEAGERGQQVILLMPAATDTRIFQKAVSTATAVVFIRGRVKFGVLRPNRRQAAASHPSALIGWNTNLSACSHLGLWMRAETGCLEAAS
jgi:hypothetical protein